MDTKRNLNVNKRLYPLCHPLPLPPPPFPPHLLRGFTIDKEENIKPISHTTSGQLFWSIIVSKKTVTECKGFHSDEQRLTWCIMAWRGQFDQNKHRRERKYNLHAIEQTGGPSLSGVQCLACNTVFHLVYLFNDSKRVLSIWAWKKIEKITVAIWINIQKLTACIIWLSCHWFSEIVGKNHLLVNCKDPTVLSQDVVISTVSHRHTESMYFTGHWSWICRKKKIMEKIYWTRGFLL